MMGIATSRIACFAAYGLATALLLGIASPGGGAAAAEFNAERHFRGKTVSLYVDFKPGGGTDTQARYFAKHFGEFLPGKPRMDVKNLVPDPAARTYVWKAKQDGLALSFLALPGIGIELTDPSLEIEAYKFKYIGAHASRDMVLYTRGDSVPYKSLKDATKGNVKLVFSERVGRPAELDGRILAIALGLHWLEVPFQILPVAQAGTNDNFLMLERGEVNSMLVGSQWYFMPNRRKGWLADGYVRPLADFGHPDDKVGPNDEYKEAVPHIYDMLTKEQQKVWDGLVLPDVMAGKSLATGPGVPDEIVKVLRDSYATAMKDPEFSAGLAKLQGQPVDLVTGDKLQARALEVHNAYKSQIPSLGKLQEELYGRYVKGR